MRRMFAIFLLLPAVIVFADLTTTHGDLKLVHARATPTPEKVKITIQNPGPGQISPQADVTVQFQSTSWNAKKNGKHFHFVLDNNPSQDHYSNDPFVFKNVSPGAHVIRVFPVHPWHETVKQQEAIAMVAFYVKEKSGEPPLNFSKPMLVYSTPAGSYKRNQIAPGQPQPGILVDWFLHNVSMGSKAGYYVRISVNGTELMSMKEWRPHYVQGLKPGNHRIKLELLENGVPVPENWNVTERTITVES